MSTMKVRWHVNELANVMSLFDVQKVYRSTAGDEGPWNEITTPATRVPLVVDVEDYLYDDTSGDPSFYYAVSYFNSTTSAESGLSDPMRGDVSGYVGIEDIRDEGFSDSELPDERLIYGIALATSTIDRITRRFFEPRNRTFLFDGRGSQVGKFQLRIPIIALTEVKVDDAVVPIDTFKVYNRHLTQGLTMPDDRDNPMVSYDLGSELEIEYLVDIARFLRGRQNISLAGIFGYTELGPDDAVGETSPGSQVPLSYGETPPLIKRAAMLLTVRYAFTTADGDGDDFSRRLAVTKVRTRDQEILWGGMQGSMSGDGGGIPGLTGDTEVDNILALYKAPPNLGAI